MISSGNYVYSYDSINNLVKITNNIDNYSYAYIYDSLNRRVAKISLDDDQANDIRYLYDGTQVIEELYFNDDKICFYILSSTIDKPITISTSEGTYYYHYDSQGSVKIITDNDGKLVESYEYTHMGKITITNNIGIVIPLSLVGNQYGFTGRRLDIETGLIYFRARFYNSDIGMFLSKDPMMFIDGQNMCVGYFYMYLLDDPSGLVVKKIKNKIKNIKFSIKLGGKNSNVSLGFHAVPGSIGGVGIGINFAL